MNTSRINIEVGLDENKIPESISWNASQSNSEDPQQAKAMSLAFWDGKERSVMRIDLWTRQMMVDEMADFYYQHLMGLADSFERSTHQQELVEDMRRFAHNFFRKFRSLQQKPGKAGEDAGSTA